MTKKKLFVGVLVIFVMIGVIFIVQKAGRPKGLVAFVIDDWGYNRENIDLLFQIKRPVTVAILPKLRYSKYTAEAIRQNSKIYDIILHLPLESKSGEAEEIETIQCDMDRKEIIAILEEDIKSAPGLIGISNHQGSKATEDERVMKVILSELKRRGLFFLDSMTTPDSVCPRIARNLRLRYAERDVFLDLTDQTDLKNFRSYIRNQIKELADVAIREGRAIGIGHNKRVMLEVLRDSIPTLEKKGIKIVPLKKLMR